jgi:hypothetical protein
MEDETNTNLLKIEANNGTKNDSSQEILKGEVSLYH